MIDTKEILKQIYKAVSQGETNIAISLLDTYPELIQKETPFGSWLHVAATAGHFELIGELVRRGIDINRNGGTFGGSAINVAAANGHINVVNHLLELGSELDVSEPERNPMFSAIHGGHLEIVKLLMKSGINHRIKYTGEYMKDMDALAFARERGQSEIARYLEAPPLT
jgi:ankyrin repeat protein